jgi:fatty acid desaturase
MRRSAKVHFCTPKFSPMLRRWTLFRDIFCEISKKVFTTGQYRAWQKARRQKVLKGREATWYFYHNLKRLIAQAPANFLTLLLLFAVCSLLPLLRSSAILGRYA